MIDEGKTIEPGSRDEVSLYELEELGRVAIIPEGMQSLHDDRSYAAYLGMTV